MNRNYIIAFAVTLAALGILAFAAWALFETEPTTKLVSPSSEARRNQYLALDRWLQSSGIPVRIEKSGDLSTIMEAKEKQIFIQASLFRWNDEAVDYFIDWIDGGGTLFLVLEMSTNTNMMRLDDYPYSQYDWYGEESLLLLEEFGITTETGTGLPGFHYDPEAPSFDHDVSFEIDEDMDALTLKDWTGLIRLVEVKSGKGRLIVSGRPRFLLSPYIGDAPNARLAWAIFGTDDRGAAAPAEGCLFIRGKTKVSGLFGSLWRQGNMSVLLVSVLVLLVTGFWMVIPIFGLVRDNDDKLGKPLRERFLAEGRFLKRYDALELYRLVYVKEIRRRFGRKEGLSSDEEIESRLLAMWGKTSGDSDSGLLARAFRGEPFTYREFPKMIHIFKTILERI